MKWRTTAALLLLVIGIGTYISLYEIRQPLPQERDQLAKQIVDLPLPSVSRIAIELPLSTVTLARDADGVNWRMEPSQVRADTELIQRILYYTNPLTATRVLPGVGGPPLDLRECGLDPALGQITWISDGRPTALLLGGTTPVGMTRYAKLPDRPDVFVIPPDLFDDANRPPAGFRDPRLLRFSTGAVHRITRTTPSAAAELTRQDKAWRLVQPTEGEADGNAVDALFRTLVGLRIQRYVEETPMVEQAATWGLDAPALELTLAFQQPPPPASQDSGRAGGGEVTLFFGKPLPDDSSLIYAKRSDEPGLYAVAWADVEPLAQARFEAVTEPVPE